MTVRGSSTPKRALVKRTESLTLFFQRLGRAMYDADWRPPSLNSGSNSDADLGSPEEMADIVRSQIIAGIRLGKVRLIQSCSIDALQQKKPSVADTSQSTARRWPAADDEDEPSWQISPSYWLDGPMIDWCESIAQVECDDIIDVQNKRKLLDKFEDPKRRITVHLNVDDPDRSIRDSIVYTELPSDDWFKTHNRYVGIALRECVAAAWRAATVTSLENKHGIQEKLVSAMSEYAAFNDIKIDEEALRTAARKIKKQWTERDLKMRVFVNSNRLK